MNIDPSVELPLIAIGALCTIAVSHAIYSVYRSVVDRHDGRPYRLMASCIAGILTLVLSATMIVWFFFLILIVLEDAGITASIYECAKRILFGGIVGICIFFFDIFARREFLPHFYDDELDERDEG